MNSFRSSLRRHLLAATAYEGADGAAWFVGYQPRAASIAPFFCGDDARARSHGRVLRRSVPRRIERFAREGGVSVVTVPDGDAELPGPARQAIRVPELVDIHTDLPGDVDALRDELVTSTTREDFRRIRRANFSYRVTSDPEAIREFHARHYTPLVEKQFPEDGRIGSIGRLLREVDEGGELVCADLDGTWVAGMFSIARPDSYALMHLGIRDADEVVRQKRVAAALIVRSLERAVELGRTRATLGRSLPFLGKGPVWFKAKWGGVLTCEPTTRDMHLFMDLRHTAVRRTLANSPVIHREGDTLVASMWLEPGEKPLQAAVRDARRFPGISKWYLLSETATLTEGAVELAAADRIVPVAITAGGNEPIWLGEMLTGRS